MSAPLCHCGRELHYSDPAIQKKVEGLISQFGKFVTVRTIDGRRWRVPRHYIALHGVKAWEIKDLGFEEIHAER